MLLVSTWFLSSTHSTHTWCAPSFPSYISLERYWFLLNRPEFNSSMSNSQFSMKRPTCAVNLCHQTGVFIRKADTPLRLDLPCHTWESLRIHHAPVLNSLIPTSYSSAQKSISIPERGKNVHKKAMVTVIKYPAPLLLMFLSCQHI